MKILVGIDGGTQQQAALNLAAQLAPGGAVVVATVYPWDPSAAPLGAAYAKTLDETAAEILRDATEQLPAGVSAETRSIADLHTARALHDAALEVGADVIVIGACHRGAVGHALLGGTGESVVHGSPCPVVVAPHDYAGDVSEPRRIGVAYDGTPESDAALDWAIRLAGDAGATVRIITVWQALPVGMYPGVAAFATDGLVAEMREEAEQRVERALERVPESVPAESRVLDGPVIRSLLDAEEGVDLFVAGSRGYGPVGSLLMGSVSRPLMYESTRPVVVVPRAKPSDPAAAGHAGAMSTVA